MKPILTPFLIALGMLTGCVAPTLPRETAGLTLTSLSSVSVSVSKPVFQVQERQLVLHGHVYKQFMGPSTEGTHLDIVYLNSAEQEILLETALFRPKKLCYHARKSLFSGHYEIQIQEIPAGTTKIEVRAHDGLHSAS